MNKHEELTNEQFRNILYYHLTQKKISKETYDLVIAERDISEQTEKELSELKKIISSLAYFEKSDNDTHIDRFHQNLIKLVEKGNEYRKIKNRGKVK